jgi:hypothetical protein
VTNLDDRLAQFQLAQGTISLTVRSISPDGLYEIDTPTLAVTINQPGVYRVTVTPDGQSTYVLVRAGAATASAGEQSYDVSAGQSYNFAGADLSNYTYYDPPAPDDFDHFCQDRDSRWQHAASLRYVSPDMIGYEDLDANGTWQSSDAYGMVWVPNNVPADWAPYHDGHWAWVQPWGWTWVDDAPWGFAPFHYGRWVMAGPGWAWVPGPVAVAPVYAPALVAFVGGPGFSVGVGGAGVAWFPLGPREVYRPGYEVSVNYVQRVNVTNTTVTTTFVTNVYNNPGPVHYAYQAEPRALVAVPSAAFAGGQSVGRNAVHLAPGAIANAPINSVAPVAPTERALTGPGTVSNAHPSAATLARPVVARTAPPPAPVSFAAKQQALATNPGHPIAASTEAQLRQAPANVIARPQPQVIARPAQAAVAPPQRPAQAVPGGAPGAATRPGFSPAAPATPAARPGMPATPAAPGAAARPATPSELQGQRPGEDPRQNFAPRPSEALPGRPQVPVQAPGQAARPDAARQEQPRAPAGRPEPEKNERNEKKDDR